LPVSEQQTCWVILPLFGVVADRTNAARDGSLVHTFPEIRSVLKPLGNETKHQFTSAKALVFSERRHI
jgi:hypothetical protein